MSCFRSRFRAGAPWSPWLVPLLALPLVSWVEPAPHTPAPPVWSFHQTPLVQPTDGLLDVGSFTLILDGQRAGREQFSVRRTTTADGATLDISKEMMAATARIVHHPAEYASRRVYLETNPGFVPAKVEVSHRRHHRWHH